jgi:hypothetical protein
MKQRRPRSAAGVGTLRDPLEQFGGHAILALVEGVIGFPQDGRDLSVGSLSQLTAECSAH